MEARKTQFSDIVILSKLLVDNNAGSVITELNKRGFKISAKTNLVKLLSSIYLIDKKKYYKLAQSIRYNNSAKNYTNSMNLHKGLKKVIVKKLAN